MMFWGAFVGAIVGILAFGVILVMFGGGENGK